MAEAGETQGRTGPAPPPLTEQAFLTPEERNQAQRILSFPEEFPRKFGSWIAEYIAVNGLEVPASQIRGINQFRPLTAVLGSSVSIGATSYTAAGGPTLNDVGQGTYMLLYGFQFCENTGNNEGYALASPSVNDAVPGDGDAVRSQFMLGSDDTVSPADQTTGSSIFFKIVTLTEPQNTISMRYRVTDGAVSFTNVYIIALKLSN